MDNFVIESVEQRQVVDQNGQQTSQAYLTVTFSFTMDNGDIQTYTQVITGIPTNDQEALTSALKSYAATYKSALAQQPTVSTAGVAASLLGQPQTL